MKYVYTYYPSTGVEATQVVAQNANTITVHHGFSGELVRKSELDNGGRYFTTRQRAIEHFITRGEQRLSAESLARSPLAESDIVDWHKMLRIARKILSTINHN